MARPTKTLQEHLRDGSFRADRHAGLLLGPLVDDPELAGLQATYRTAASTDEQRLDRDRLRPGGEAARGTKAAPDPERTRRRRGRGLLRRQLRPHEGTGGRASVRARGLAARLRGRVLQARRGGQAHLSPRRPRRAARERKEPARGRARPLRAPDPARLPRRLLRRRLAGAGADRLQLRPLLRRDGPAPRRRPRGPKRAHLSRRHGLDAGRLRRRVAPVRALGQLRDRRRGARLRHAEAPGSLGGVRDGLAQAARLLPPRHHDGRVRPHEPARAPGRVIARPALARAPRLEGSRSGATRRTACSSGGTPPRTRPSSTTRRPGARPTRRAGSTCATCAASETHRGRPSPPSAACT